MSKKIAVKKPEINLQGSNSKNVPSVPIKPANGVLETIRDVTSSASAVQVSESKNVIVQYKDLNLEKKLEVQSKRNELFFALLIFVSMGFALFLWQSFNKGSVSQSSNAKIVNSPHIDATIPPGTETISQSYHYDKSCYLNEKGEQVCITKTSQKFR